MRRCPADRKLASRPNSLLHFEQKRGRTEGAATEGDRPVSRRKDPAGSHGWHAAEAVSPLSGDARERQLGFLRRPAANAVRLHVDLMHLPALLPAVVIGALQACRLDFSPRCHTTPHLGRHGVMAVASGRHFGDRCTGRQKGQGRKGREDGEALHLHIASIRITDG